jgi:hypothetical protein
MTISSFGGGAGKPSTRSRSMPGNRSRSPSQPCGRWSSRSTPARPSAARPQACLLAPLPTPARDLPLVRLPACLHGVQQSARFSRIAGDALSEDLVATKRAWKLDTMPIPQEIQPAPVSLIDGELPRLPGRAAARPDPAYQIRGPEACSGLAPSPLGQASRQRLPRGHVGVKLRRCWGNGRFTGRRTLRRAGTLRFANPS